MTYITKKITFLIALLFIASSGNQATATLLNSVHATSGKAYLWNVSQSSEDSDDEYVELDDVEHYSQSDEAQMSKVPNKVKRTEFNDKIITQRIGSLQGEINTFKSTPTSVNLETLLFAIADIANKAYNDTKVGKKIGTYKHKFCKDFMVKIKSNNNGTTFDNVHPEYSLDTARFDVIWFNNKDAYVFDYKFGEDNNKSSKQDSEDYKQVLSKNGYTMKGNIKDIHP